MVTAKRDRAGDDGESMARPGRNDGELAFACVRSLPVFQVAHDGSVDVASLALLPSSDSHVFHHVRLFASPTGIGNIVKPSALLEGRKGVLYIATNRLYWFCSDEETSELNDTTAKGIGIAINYKALLMHAIAQSAVASVSDSSSLSAVYCQLDLTSPAFASSLLSPPAMWSTVLASLEHSDISTVTKESVSDNEEEESFFPELWITPDDQGAVDAIFQALSTCSAMHPDKAQESSDEDNNSADQEDSLSIQGTNTLSRLDAMLANDTEQMEQEDCYGSKTVEGQFDDA